MDDLYIYTHTSPQIQESFKAHLDSILCQTARKASYTFKNAIQYDWLSLTGTYSKATLQVCHKVFKKSDYISRMFQLSFVPLVRGDMTSALLVTHLPLITLCSWKQHESGYLLCKDEVSEDPLISKWRDLQTWADSIKYTHLFPMLFLAQCFKIPVSQMA